MGFWRHPPEVRDQAAACLSAVARATVHVVVGVALGDLLGRGLQGRRPGQRPVPHGRLRERGCSTESERDDPPRRLVGPVGAHEHRDVLLAVDLVSHGRGADRAVGVEAPEPLAGIRVVGGEHAGAIALEHEAGGGREEPAAIGHGVAHGPAHLARHGIERLQESLPRRPLRIVRGGDQVGVPLAAFDAEVPAVETSLVDAGLRELQRQRVEERELLRGDEGQAPRGIPGHRVPGVRAAVAGQDPLRLVLVVGSGVLHGTARLEIDVGGPVQRGEGERIEQFPVLTV